MASSFLIALLFFSVGISVFNTFPLIYGQNREQEYIREYPFHIKWGSKGTGDGQFMRPHDVEFDFEGNVYVGDRARNDIQKFTPDGRFLDKFGSEGTGDGEFRVPYSISIAKSDYLYVVDRDNNRIQKFFTNGTFITKSQPPAGDSGINYEHPEDMAVDTSSGFIYVTDTGNNRIVKLDSDLNFILEWGSEGTGEGQFIHPHGIGVDSSGNVYVNDLENPGIQKFYSNGTFITQWGSAGTEDGQFTPPLEHLVVDSSDNVWMVDGAGNPRVQKFYSNGTFITSVGTGPCIIEEEVKEDQMKMSEPLSCDGEMHEPEHVNIDSSGNLYEVDRGNHRIQIFSPNTSGSPGLVQQPELLGGKTQDRQEKFMAKMAGSEEVPFVTSTASGIAEFKPSSQRQELMYTLNVTDIEQVISADMHLGKEGERGPIVLRLFSSDSPLDFKRKTGVLEEGKNVTASDFEGPMAGKPMSDFFSSLNNGSIYVNVNTEENPEGEIRGQVTNAGTK